MHDHGRWTLTLTFKGIGVSMQKQVVTMLHEMEILSTQYIKNLRVIKHNEYFKNKLVRQIIEESSEKETSMDKELKSINVEINGGQGLTCQYKYKRRSWKEKIEERKC